MKADQNVTNFMFYDIEKSNIYRISEKLSNYHTLQLIDVFLCLSGDDRHQVVPQLSVIHIVFLREHNRIAAELQEINPHWDDERLFQEAKKILTGMHQHIVYNEFLPMFVGQETARQKNLLSSEKGLKKTYNSNEDPSTVNEFGVAAYRVGHSLVGRFVNALDKNFHKEVPGEGEKLRKVFLDNTRIRDDDFGPDGIGRWMASTCMRERDRFISDQLRNHLFEDPVVSKVNKASDGFDLISINIQRARDHGKEHYYFEVKAFIVHIVVCRRLTLL